MTLLNNEMKPQETVSLNRVNAMFCTNGTRDPASSNETSEVHKAESVTLTYVGHTSPLMVRFEVRPDAG